MSEKTENSLEQHFNEIESIVAEMEKSSNSLEQSFDLYKKGLAELEEANKILDSIEKEMLVLNENGDLEDFDA